MHYYSILLVQVAVEISSTSRQVTDADVIDVVDVDVVDVDVVDVDVVDVDVVDVDVVDIKYETSVTRIAHLIRNILKSG